MLDAGYWILDRGSTPSQIGLIIQYPASSETGSALTPCRIGMRKAFRPPDQFQAATYSTSTQ
jgi:hypothetical protein